MNHEQKTLIKIIILMTTLMFILKLFKPISWIWLFMPAIGATGGWIAAWLYVNYILE